MLRTLDLLASDSSHLPFLYVFKESGVMEKYGFEIDLHIVGGAKAPTMGIILNIIRLRVKRNHRRSSQIIRNLPWQDP